MSTATPLTSTGTDKARHKSAPSTAPTLLNRSGALALAVAIGFGGVGAGILTAPAAQAATDVSYTTPQQNGADWGLKLGVNVSGSWSGEGASGFSDDHFLGSRYIGGQPVDTDGYCIMLGTPSTSQALLASNLVNANGAAANYILAKPTTTAAEKASVQVAMSLLLDPKFNVPLTTLSSSDLAIVGLVKYGADAAPYRAAAQALIAEAQAAMGVAPSVQPQLAIAADGQSGTVTSTGTGVNGLTATYTLTGPAVFSNGTNTITGPATGANLSFTATGNGAVKVDETAIGVLGNTPIQYSAPLSQTLVAVGPTTTVSGASADVQVTFTFQPAATSTAPVYLEAGQALTDVLHVGTADGLPWLAPGGSGIPAVFNVDWYYSPTTLPASAQIPAAAVKVATGQATATAAGDVTATADKPADKNGFYYPVARFSKAAQPAALQKYFTGDWIAGFNDPGEQSIVKYTPQVTTKASVIENGKVHDVITVTGNEPGKALTVTTDLILTSEKTVEGGTDTAPADAVKIGTVTTTVTGNGEFTTPSVDVPWEKIITDKWGADKPANLYFSEKIPATETTKEWDGKELLPNETIPVIKPAVSTKASQNGTVPVIASDTAIVTGDVPSSPTVLTTLGWKLFKFGDDVTSSVQAVCQNEFWASKASLEVPKAGEYVSEQVTLKDKGTYGYIETLTAKYTDANGNIKTSVLHEGKCGEKLETVIAFPQDVPASPEKPALTVPSPQAPAPHNPGTAPVAYTGEVTAHQELNTPLLFAGGATILAGLVIGGIWYQRRRAAALNTTDQDTNTEHSVG
ncbi:hypothetical protein [Paenarthrobacter histidinolovorans]|uniref:Uncharacterized protein n=1 Tax=Paenarthrobacter histidinolovorans TaxID=43664 RepID=A0ABW8MZJ4_9MICC